MRSWSKVNQASAAVSNRRLVLHLLRESGSLSRRQLAESSGLRSSTLTYITRDLMDRGVVRNCGKRDRPGAGKKQQLLEISPEFGWVVGVGLEGNVASLVFLNTRGEVIDRDRALLREPVDMLPQALRTRIQGWVERHGSPAGDLLGVGVGVPGIVDPQRGLVLRSTRYRMENWPLAEVFSRCFGVPVAIDNDSNLATIAEARMGNAQAISNFLYFLINTTEDGAGYSLSSLGSSLFLNGALHRGACFGSGEINVQVEGEPYGRIQAEALLAICDPEGPFGDPLRQLADHMVRTLVAITDLVDPAAVILGGNLAISNQRMITYIQQQLNEQIAHVPGRQVALWPSRHMDHGVSMGAAITALEVALLASDVAVPVDRTGCDAEVMVAG